MSTYTDRSGKTYKYHKGFNQGGDFVLIDDDNLAFRVESFHLKAASPVFRSMLQTVDSDDQSAHIPNTSCGTLALCLAAITGERSARMAWSAADPAISWCKKYECFAACRTLLRAAVRSLNTSWVFQAFTVATNLNEVSAGHRILLQGWKSEEYNSSYPRTKATTLRPRTTWKLDMANGIPGPWLLALVRAEETADSKHSKMDQVVRKVEYWMTLATAFLLEFDTV